MHLAVLCTDDHVDARCAVFDQRRPARPSQVFGGMQRSGSSQDTTRVLLSLRRGDFSLNDTANSEIFTLRLHDALPIVAQCAAGVLRSRRVTLRGWRGSLLWTFLVLH